MISFSDVTQNFDFLMKGLAVTFKLALVSITGSLILGVILGIIRYSRVVLFSWLAALYVEVVRSIPLILFIIFIHFGFLPYIVGVETSFFQSSAIALIVFTSAYIAEIIRSGLKSIEMGHIDAARSLGLNYFQRLIYIILPLSVKRMTPALVSQFISLIKDTSLASTIGLIELTRSGEIIYERTYREFEILIFIALVYFIICFSLSLLSKKLESKQF
ncbi:MAG: amino acid ABC transporter permease [bacterium]